MISIRAISTICLGATLCAAETITIRGVVKDAAGVGIPGATVKLDIAKLSATTKADGKFTLSNDPSHIQQNVNGLTMAECPVRLQDGRITIRLSGTAPVAVSIHDVGGRRIYNSKKTYGSGTHAVQAPPQSAGVSLYRITIGNEAYSFKSSPFGTFSTERPAVSNGTSTVARQAKASAAFADVIHVIKEGQVTYRHYITQSVMSDFEIKMKPNAGSVTDKDGHVYQSVKIGKQIWVTEDWKCTKYNDGTEIPNVKDNNAWSALKTPAYCFYNNTTNADTIKKYGALYNWYTVSKNNPKQIAPEGWHVSTKEDYDELEAYLIANGFNWDGSTTENKIAKALAEKAYWTVSDKKDCGAIGYDFSKNNASGFAAIMSGYRSGGFFTGRGHWWTSSETYDTDMHYEKKPSLARNSHHTKDLGFAVRLVKD